MRPRKMLLLLIFFFISNGLLAQSEPYKNAISQFQKMYNEGAYEKIFESFSPEMQQALPLDKANPFFAGLKAQVGKMQSTQFLQNGQETYASYKVHFEKMAMTLNLSLDGNNKINGLFIKPFEEKQSETDHSNRINALQLYPLEIAKIIFSKTRSFPENTQLSIAVIQNGQTQYYGIINKNDSISPINNQNNIFEIGSITKVFTSTLLATVVTEGKIKLTDPINSYYPFPFKDGLKITFGTLANHTSGLPRLPQNIDLSNDSNPYKSYGSKELNNYLQNFVTTENPPSTHYSYSNIGSGLLGFTLGLVEKTSYQDLLKRRIFKPFDMNHSYVRASEVGDLLVKGLNAEGQPVSNWDFDALFAAGGILSTTSDLTKFAKAQFDLNNKALALTRKPTFSINENMKIGLGWHIISSSSGDLFWHNGGTGGYSSSMAVNPQNQTAVIILSNVSPENPSKGNIDQLCFELMNTIVEK